MEYFNAVGFGLDGDMGYVVGFSILGNAGPTNHPSSTYKNAAATVDESQTYCAQTNVECTISKSGSLATHLPANQGTSNTAFAFGAVANLDSETTTRDQWSINEDQ